MLRSNQRVLQGPRTDNTFTPCFVCAEPVRGAPPHAVGGSCGDCDVYVGAGKPCAAYLEDRQGAGTIFQAL